MLCVVFFASILSTNYSNMLNRCKSPMTVFSQRSVLYSLIFWTQVFNVLKFLTDKFFNN